MHRWLFIVWNEWIIQYNEKNSSEVLIGLCCLCIGIYLFIPGNISYDFSIFHTAIHECKVILSNNSIQNKIKGGQFTCIELDINIANENCEIIESTIRNLSFMKLGKRAIRSLNIWNENSFPILLFFCHALWQPFFLSHLNT